MSLYIPVEELTKATEAGFLDSEEAKNIYRSSIGFMFGFPEEEDNDEPGELDGEAVEEDEPEQETDKAPWAEVVPLNPKQ